LLIWPGGQAISMLRLLFLTGLSLFLAACMEDGEPILRGKCLTEIFTGSSEPTQGEPISVPDEAVENDVSIKETDVIPVAAGTKGDDAPSANVDVSELPILHDYAKEKPPLNLSLPREDWGDGSYRSRSNVLPDVFARRIPEQVMNLSGKLYWDESEEARTRPIEETIKGAEVELQFYLP